MAHDLDVEKFELYCKLIFPVRHLPYCIKSGKKLKDTTKLLNRYRLTFIKSMLSQPDLSKKFEKL